MKMKVQHLMDATIIVSDIIRENRKLPTKGKYWLSRMHGKLLPHFKHFNGQRDERIASYNYFPMVPNPEAARLSEEARQAMILAGHLDKLPPAMIQSPVMGVPPEEMEAFTAEWEEIGKTEIDVDVRPIHIDTLCFPGDLADGEITSHEFIVLGDLIVE